MEVRGWEGIGRRRRYWYLIMLCHAIQLWLMPPFSYIRQHRLVIVVWPEAMDEFLDRFENRWEECYWCGWWSPPGTFLDDHALCDWCLDRYMIEGRPYSPNAADRVVASLVANKLLPVLFPAELLPRLADFLVHLEP